MELGFVNFWKIVMLNMLVWLEYNSIVISEVSLIIKRVKHRDRLGQLWRAVKMWWDITVGGELDHEFLV